MSTFKYRPVTWMFYDKTENNSINKIHKRTLWLIWRSEVVTFEDLLERDEFKSIHEKNAHITYWNLQINTSY